MALGCEFDAGYFRFTAELEFDWDRHQIVPVPTGGRVFHVGGSSEEISKAATVSTLHVYRDRDENAPQFTIRIAHGQATRLLAAWVPVLLRTSDGVAIASYDADKLWLQIELKNKTRWIRGDESFRAIGLHPAIALAQTNVWQHVRLDAPTQLKRITVPKEQLAVIVRAFIANNTLGEWPCDLARGAEADWTQSLIFEDLPVSSTQQVMLVEAGQGCARDGQGANGAMWVLRFEGSKPVLLATPKQRFNGWLYSIQPTASHGLHDLILGWHMSAMETGLGYFRFDGTSYRQIGAADQIADVNGNQKIIPNRILN
jgi:hypothetical protein